MQQSWRKFRKETGNRCKSLVVGKNDEHDAENETDFCGSPKGKGADLNKNTGRTGRCE